MKTYKSIFDDHAKTYNENHQKSIRLSGYKTDYFHEYKVSELYNYICRSKIKSNNIKILNFGCGVGKSEPFFASYFPKAKIFGCDVSQKSIQEAKKSNKSIKNINYKVFNLKEIPFSEKFDIVFVSNVFHHIPKESHIKTSMLLKKVLNKNGFLIIFEHNPCNPLTVLLYLLTDFRYDPNSNLLSPWYMKNILKKSGFTFFNITFKIFFFGFLKKLIPYERYLKKCFLGAHYYFIAK